MPPARVTKAPLTGGSTPSTPPVCIGGRGCFPEDHVLAVYLTFLAVATIGFVVCWRVFH